VSTSFAASVRMVCDERTSQITVNSTDALTVRGESLRCACGPSATTFVGADSAVIANFLLYAAVELTSVSQAKLIKGTYFERVGRTCSAGRHTANAINGVEWTRCWRRPNPNGHELLASPAGAEVSGLQNCSPLPPEGVKCHVRTGPFTFCAM